MSKNVTNLYQHNPSFVSMPFHLTIEMTSKDKLGRNEHKMNIYLCILKRSSDSYGYASFASAILQNTRFSGRKGYEYMQHICTVPTPPIDFVDRADTFILFSQSYRNICLRFEVWYLAWYNTKFGILLLINLGFQAALTVEK